MQLNPIRRGQVNAFSPAAVSLTEDVIALHKMDVRLGDSSHLG